MPSEYTDITHKWTGARTKRELPRTLCFLQSWYEGTFCFPLGSADLGCGPGSYSFTLGQEVQASGELGGASISVSVTVEQNYTFTWDRCEILALDPNSHAFRPSALRTPSDA